MTNHYLQRGGSFGNSKLANQHVFPFPSILWHGRAPKLEEQCNQNTLDRVMKLRRRIRRRHVKGPSPPRKDTFCRLSSRQHIANMSQTGTGPDAPSRAVVAVLEERRGMDMHWVFDVTRCIGEEKDEMWRLFRNMMCYVRYRMKEGRIQHVSYNYNTSEWYMCSDLSR